MGPASATHTQELSQAFRCGHAPHNGAISAGCLVGSRFWGTNQISSWLWKLKNLEGSFFSFCGIFPACLLPASREDQANVFQFMLKAMPILYALVEIQKCKGGCCGLGWPEGSVRPAGSAWCESPAGGRGSRATPLPYLARPGTRVIPWPHSEAGREASMFGTGILGDHRWEAQSLLWRSNLYRWRSICPFPPGMCARVPNRGVL